MIRFKVLLAFPLAVLAVLGSGIGTSAAAQPTQSCNGIADPYAASGAQLQACGFTQVPQSGTTALPGGGVSYNYTLPDGQTYSIDQTPPAFNPLTASAAEDSAYGLPPAPPMSSPGYASWLTMANSPWAPATPRPYLVVADQPTTTTTPGISPNLTVKPNGSWAGYSQAGSGWTEAEAAYYEPHLGNTSCSNPGVSFWAGIGIQGNALGQDGTWSGNGAPGLHQVFFENLPNGAAFPGVVAYAGYPVLANVQYQGSNSWTYNINVNGTNHIFGGTGNYDGSIVEAIAERPIVGSGNVPLLNFQSININALVGRGLGEMSPTNQWVMTNYATTGSINNGDFTVTQNHCNG